MTAIPMTFFKPQNKTFPLRKMAIRDNRPNDGYLASGLFEMHKKRLTQSLGKLYMFTVTMRNVSKVSSLRPRVPVTTPVNYSIDGETVIQEYTGNEKQPTVTQFLNAIDKLTDDLKESCTAGVVGMEVGKKGRRHAHIVLKCEDDKKMQMLDSMWKHNTTTGKVIMSREIKDEHRAIAYVVKYATKDYYNHKMPEREWSW